MRRAWAQPWGKVVALVLVFALGFGLGFPSGVQYVKWQVRRAITQAFDGVGGELTTSTQPYAAPASPTATVQPYSTAAPSGGASIPGMGMEGADYPKGTEGDFGSLTMKVTGVDCSKTSWKGGGSVVTAPQDRQLCVISTQITNKTNYPQTVSFDPMLVDAAGNWYAYGPNNYDEGIYTSLNPTESVKYDVVFVIPKGQTPALLSVTKGYGDPPYVYDLRSEGA